MQGKDNKLELFMKYQLREERTEIKKRRQIVNDLFSLKVDPLRRELQSLESAAKVKSEEAEKMTKLISTLENRLVIRSSCYTILSFSSLFLYNIRTMCSSRSI